MRQYLIITENMSWYGFGTEDMSSYQDFHKSRVEIIMISFCTILLHGIGLGLSNAIRYSFTLLVGVH